MNSFVKIYDTTSSGTISNIPDTGQDVLLIHNTATIAVSVTIPLPATPVDGQRFTVSSATGSAAATLSSSLTIIGGLTAMAVGGNGTWIYDKTGNKWFKL